jgi:hypothetical protein
MSDNVLKKQFQKRDVERLRNLVKGKYGDRTTVGIGYSKPDEESHAEGDIWEIDGKKWTIKDGIKENITKLDKFKNLSIPLFCSKCKQVMDKQLDPFYFKSYGECLDCRTVTETQMKINGTWENYVNETHNKEIDQSIEAYKSFIHDKLSESNNSYVTEAGDVQKWIGGLDKERALASLDEVIEYLNSLKKS